MRYRQFGWGIDRWSYMDTIANNRPDSIESSQEKGRRAMMVWTNDG
jgi:hypothetical protein